MTKKKIGSWGAENFTFTLYEDGSGEFKRGRNPKETVELNANQILDVYADINRYIKRNKIDISDYHLENNV
jgi:hypothetical protein